MPKIDITGLHGPVFVKKPNGLTYGPYWYLGRERGAPRINGKPGTPEFLASLNEAVRDQHVPEPGKFKALVTEYKTSEAYKKLEPTTKAAWGPWLDRIVDDFGRLSIAAFDNPRARVNIRRWRNQFAATPRKADMGLQVLSRVCSHAVDPLGKLASNPCEGIAALYSSDRAEIIWTDSKLARIKPHATPEVADVIDLAALTGLRRGDLLRLSWSHVRDEDNEIVITTGKSKHRREVHIPLYDELRELLARIPKRSPIVLTNSKGRPWTNDGFGTMFDKAKKAAGIGPELHFHDLRGTAATKFYVAKLDKQVIAEMLGWTEASVDTIIRKYVDRAAATKAVIRQLNEARGRAAPSGTEDREL